MSNELKKKNRKEKINRLNRIGKLVFEKVETINDFKAILDDLIIQYDFRQGALFGEEFFAKDEMKKELMLRLFENNLLHVTVLKLNDDVIASNAGVQGKGVVYLQGFNTHSPSFAKYSPGILHFLMLGLQMSKEGYIEFDLTPGGIGGYKGDLATNFYNTHDLIITSRQEKLKHQVIFNLKEFIKKKSPIKRTNLFSIANWAKKLRVILFFMSGAAQHRLKQRLSQEPQKHILLYEIDKPKGTVAYKGPTPTRKNNLHDFLLYSEKNAIITKQEFLFDAMKRLEYGHQSYTLVHENELVACLWYIDKGSKIDHPIQKKSDTSYIFVAIYTDFQTERLKGFMRDALMNIFGEHEHIASLIFKIKEDSFSIDQIIDPELINYKVIIATEFHR